jgi:hypothetical protein
MASAVVGMINEGSTLPMTGVMCVCAMLGLLVLTFGSKRLKAARAADIQSESFNQIEKF